METYSLVNPKTKEIVSRKLTIDIIDDLRIRKPKIVKGLQIVSDKFIKKTKIDPNSGKQYLELLNKQL